jgi:large subunit ribosomal protein L9
MKIILLKDVAKLGKKFEIKTVSDGHALNLLIPKGFAVAATLDAKKRLAKQIASMDMEKKIQEDLLGKNLHDLESVSISLVGKANEKGHLFAGIHAPEIVAALSQQAGIDVNPSFIVLEHPLKTTGEHMIEVKAAGKTVKFKVVVKEA